MDKLFPIVFNAPGIYRVNSDWEGKWMEEVYMSRS